MDLTTNDSQKVQKNYKHDDNAVAVGSRLVLTLT